MDQHGKSLDDVARYADRSKGFISHLTAERCMTCKPEVAERIADLLQVPLEVLFVPSVSISSGRRVQQKKKVAS